MRTEKEFIVYFNRLAKLATIIYFLFPILLIGVNISLWRLEPRDPFTITDAYAAAFMFNFISFLFLTQFLRLFKFFVNLFKILFVEKEK